MAEHCYVDDPTLAVRGTVQERAQTVVRVTLAWLVLGLPLALHKAQFASAFVWIGFQLSKLADGVEVEIPGEKIEEMLVLTRDISAENVAGEKELRSYASKCVISSSIVRMWRPFLDDIWAALRSGS